MNWKKAPLFVRLELMKTLGLSLLSYGAFMFHEDFCSQNIRRQFYSLYY